MVLLQFRVIAPAPLSKVWEYFGKFQNIAQWDPSTKSIVPTGTTSEQAGAKYKLTSLFNGKETELDYELTEVTPLKRIAAQGMNMTTFVLDEMNFKEVPNGTEIHYMADISLRHVFKLFTPWIKGDLEKMAQ